MPVQINEVIIKAHIREAAEKGEKKKTAGQGPGSAAGSGGVSPQAKEELIKECVEAVLELLNRKSER